MAQPFLDQIAEQLLKVYPEDMSKVRVVFPNRRAGLFFRKFLSKRLKKPIWEPHLMSIDEFLAEQSGRQSPDTLSLVMELHALFQGHLPQISERLDRFFFWGQMLLRDFEDVDFYLVDSRQLFTVLYRQKEMEQQFGFTEEENLRLLRAFWDTFGEVLSPQQEDFIRLWEALPEIYEDFRNQLASKGWATKAMMSRDLAEGREDWVHQLTGEVWFVGFNALTLAEEKIFTLLLEAGKAKVFWDVDALYMEDKSHEAGYFLRKLRLKSLFAATFPDELPHQFDKGIDLNVIGVPLDAGQVKKAGEILEKWAEEEDFDPERTVVVLPDEQLLVPMLQSIPPAIQQLNVTMGFNIKSSAVYSLFEHLFSLYHGAVNKEGHLSFYFKHVVNILEHPLIQRIYPEQTRALLLQIDEKRLFRVAADQLQQTRLLSLIFSLPEKDQLDHFSSILLQLYEGMGQEIEDVEGECIYHLYTQLNRLHDILEQGDGHMDLKGFHFLFRQVSQSIRLVFEGEPLEGLQIMGLLETRLLDFERVIMLSMNEGVVPDTGSLNSFIPYHVRKAFDLPTPEHRDALSAYHIYRLWQRPKQVLAFYNTEVDGLKSKGEMSRYLLQAKMEGFMKGSIWQLGTPIHLPGFSSIEIAWNEASEKELAVYLEDGYRGFSATALNNYLYCRLRFYFQYVMKLYEKEEMVEDMDPMKFGSILHETAEHLYKSLFANKGSKEVSPSDFEWLRSHYQAILREKFSDQMGEQVDNLTGSNRIAWGALDKYMQILLNRDEEYAPFKILGLELDSEEKGMATIRLSDGRGVNIRGSIDRLDEKDGLIRIIDYKTGKSELRFASVESLFDPEDANRNAYAFQTLLYGLMARQWGVASHEDNLHAGILNFRSNKEPRWEFKLNKSPLGNIDNVLEEFEERLINLLEEIYDSEKKWTQVEDAKKCLNCPYNTICDR
jgi:hypothetical protein